MDENFLLRAMKEPAVRREVARKSFKFFLSAYFPNYLSYQSAPMHEEMYRIAESTQTQLSVIVAFRGSAKSTIYSLAYPLWAVLGQQQKKFVILASNTQKQSGLHFANLKRELENNELLRQDFGPFMAEDGDWSNSRLIVAPTNARIMAVSVEQSIRGARHAQFRPDLVIADDIEDLDSVRSQEGRDKVENWFSGEILPIGDRNTKIVIVGNLLHEDSLLMRLREKILGGQRPGTFVEFPLLDDDEKIAWPGKYPNAESIEKERQLIGNEVAWHREYMLKIISPEGQLIRPEWFNFYDELPEGPFEFNAHGVDPALSLKTHSDYTAIVSVRVYGKFKDRKIYVLRHPFNKRIESPDLVEEIKRIHDAVPGKVYIEDVAYQGSLIQNLNRGLCFVEGVNPHGQDKWARAANITHAIRSGIVVFPRTGCEDLIRQMTGFGVEKHDDLLDALVYVITKILERTRRQARYFSKKPRGF